MRARNIVVGSVVFALGGALSLGLAQQKPGVTSASATQEFPVTMRQNVVAGTIPVGTKIEAKLTLATLMNGTVVPEGAVFSGEVIESAAKTATDPSRLAIRMDSVAWKKGSAPVKVYLSAWYYPTEIALRRDRPDWSNDPLDTRNSGASQRYPGPSSTRGPDFPDHGAKDDSRHRTLMKDVDVVHGNDGSIVVTSHRSNIKLDKSTTYVFASDESATK